MDNYNRHPRRHVRPLTIEELARRSAATARSSPTLADAFADLERREKRTFEPETLLDWIAQHILRLYVEPKVPATKSTPALYYKMQVRSALEAAEGWRELQESSPAKLTEADIRSWIALSGVVSAELVSAPVD